MSAGDIHVEFSLPRAGFRLEVREALPGSGICGVFGPSGAGKTTLLRVLAGLERAASGRITVGGDVWLDGRRSLPPERRRVGYVFQEPRLFRHLDVRGNLEFARRRQRPAADRVDEGSLIELLGLGALLDRRPAALSGGEAQRVAIARALVAAPRLLLMDEPLASLDRVRRGEIMPYLDGLHAELTVPVVYVSHGIDEICRLADHLLVIEKGQVTASGTIDEVLVGAEAAVLRGEDAGAVLQTTVRRHARDDALLVLEFSGGELLVPGEHPVGTPLRLRVRASDVSLCLERPQSSSILNVVAARIEALSDADAATVLVRLRAGADRLLARVTRRSVRELGLAPGDDVHAQIKSVSIRNVPGSGRLDRSPEL